MSVLAISYMVIILACVLLDICYRMFVLVI